jgi:hypothetical protein
MLNYVLPITNYKSTILYFKCQENNLNYSSNADSLALKSQKYTLGRIYFPLDIPGKDGK